MHSFLIRRKTLKMQNASSKLTVVNLAKQLCVICKSLNTESGKKSETLTGNLKDGFILSAVER